MAYKKILIINTTFNKGGAAQIARDLFSKFTNDESLSINFAYGRGSKNEGKNTYYFGNKIEFFIHLFLVRFLGLEGFGSYFSTLKLIKYIEAENFDLIHIHNLHGYYVNFFKLLKYLNKKDIKVIWTLHDEWIFTWLPAHSMGCSHCKSLEGVCINKYEYPKNYFPIFSRFMLRKKREILSYKNIELICPAKWLYNEAVNEFNLKNVDLILNGVDSDLFVPVSNKDILREKYNIPLNKKVILFSANNFRDKNKGGEYFFKLVEKLKNKPFIFCVVGFADFPDSENIFKFGYISDRKKLSEIYSLSDIYCFLSAVETAPLSVLEAMSCALPIFGFNINALNGVVDKSNGELVNYGDIDNLEKAIVNSLEDRSLLKIMGDNSRKLILDDFSQENSYLLYKNIYSLK